MIDWGSLFWTMGPNTASPIRPLEKRERHMARRGAGVPRTGKSAQQRGNDDNDPGHLETEVDQVLKAQSEDPDTDRRDARLFGRAESPPQCRNKANSNKPASGMPHSVVHWTRRFSGWVARVSAPGDESGGKRTPPNTEPPCRSFQQAKAVPGKLQLAESLGLEAAQDRLEPCEGDDTCDRCPHHGHGNRRSGARGSLLQRAILREGRTRTGVRQSRPAKGSTPRPRTENRCADPDDACDGLRPCAAKPAATIPPAERSRQDGCRSSAAQAGGGGEPRRVDAE